MKALLAIDGSAESENALDTAASLIWPPGSRLEIVHVVPADTELLGGPWMFASYDMVPAVRDRLRDEGRRLVDEAAALVGRPGLEVVGRVVDGRAATVITDVASGPGRSWSSSALAGTARSSGCSSGRCRRRSSITPRARCSSRATPPRGGSWSRPTARPMPISASPSWPGPGSSGMRPRASST